MRLRHLNLGTRTDLPLIGLKYSRVLRHISLWAFGHGVYVTWP